MSSRIAITTTEANAWALRTMTEGIIRTHHDYLRTELPFLEERIAKMCTNHGQEHPEMFRVQQILQDLRDDLTGHLAKEESILFPYIAELEEAVVNGRPVTHACFPTVRFPIRIMLMEHDAAGQLLENLRYATTDYTPPAGLCDCGREFYQRLQVLDADLREHIRTENEDLFPAAVRLEEMRQ
jgi:regulator of cell morphogenesis and NO signaling